MEEKEKVALVKVEKSGPSRRDFLRGAFTVTAGGLVVFTGIATPKPQVAQVAIAQEKAKEAPKDVYKYLFATRKYCTGCRSCEYACSLRLEKVVRPSVAAIHVKRFWGIVDVPVICWQCDDPAPCIKACPTTPVAIKRDPQHNGITYIDKKTCLGGKCNKCIEACPPQFLSRHPDTGWPIFCDTCEGEPECVKACKEQAGNDLAPCLREEKLGFGVNMAYKEVKVADAAKDLLMEFFYPSKGGR